MPKPKAWARLSCAGLAALSLAACVNDSDGFYTDSLVSSDYRVRHPVALVERPRTLDVFVSGMPGKLDIQTADRIREFAATAGTDALAPITILLPRGSTHDRLTRAALPAIRRALLEGGARGYVNVGTYPVVEAGLASPVRLSFEAVEARVATPCGEWPRDIASGSSLAGWENRPYWNFGCAYQSNFARQVADPRDLVAARAEDPSDVQMRMRAIGNVRKGADPGTTWVIKNTNLGQAGGN